ncbi:unnamed protein product [Schistosoma bovis]|nr:unnamed protein product [Schistosoma bovis]
MSMLGDSRSLVLRVHLPKAGITKTTAFDAQMTVGQACERIRAQVRESDQTDGAKDYGLFLPHEDNKKGLWLDNSRTLEHYILRNGDTVEYRYRYRWLYIRTMDGTRKTLKVDDSKTVAELMLMICTKMGIYNYEEYLLARDRDETDRERTNTLKRSTGHHHHTGTLMRDQEKMEKLKRKLHTDDDMEWLNPSQSLRQQGVDEKEILLLKRRYFFSDMNVDARDPVQLNLLYVQLKDAILKGTHPVSLEEAVYLAGIQCQVQFGNYVAEKFKPNFLDLKDFLPKEYAKIRSLEKKIFQQHAELCGLSEIEAKVKYCQFCRSLKTYGITFFLVKERIKGKNKLIPRLLGITKDSVVRLDEKTKEVLKIWPLTSICKWAASPHAFTMDFGEYSPDEYYTAQTSEGEQISQLIAGYIDIILKKQKATDHPGLQGDEESAMYEENVQAERATIVQHQRVPVRGRGKDQLVNGVVEKPFDIQQHRNDLSSHQMNTNGVWSIHQQNNLVGDENSTVIDGQSVLTATTTRQMSPDNFMTGGTHIFHYQEMSPAQKSLLVTINEDLETLQAAKENLDIGPPTERHLLNIGTDEASKRWLSESMGASQAKVTDEVGAMNAAVAQALRSANRAESTDINVVQQGQPLDQIHDPGDDLMMMQQSFRVVTIHFPAFVDDLKRVAVLRRESGALKADQTGQPIIADKTEESTQNLLSAARHVADAFTDLLQSARPLAMGQTHEEIYPTSDDGTYNANHVITQQQGPVSSSSRKAIIEAASRVGAASNDLLRHVMHGGDDDDDLFNTNYLILTDEERIYQDQLLGLAKAVANATAGLVVKAKVLASQITSDPEAQQRVIASVTQTGLCTSQLVACTKVLAPTIHQPTCQQQLSEAGREVTWAVDGVVQASRAAVHVPSEDPQMVQQSIIETETAATEVRDALDQLNAHLLKGSYKGYQGDALNSFQTSYEDLKQYYTTDGQRMVASARRLAQATALMIADIKAQAEESGDDSDRQNRLFHAAKQLADATTNLINAAKACSSNPDNIQLQTELRDAADELYTLAYSAGGEQFQTRLIHNLQSAARATVTGATQLVNISQAATKYSRGNSYQLHNDTKNVTNLIPKTVITIRESRANPDDPMALLELIGACERFVQPCTAMVRSSKSLAPTLSDPSIQAALENSNSQLASALETLITCLIKVAPLARHLQLDGALTRLTRLSDEVAGIETSLIQGTLTPIPEQRVEDCCHLLNISVHDGTESAKKLDSIINSMAKMDSTVLNQPELAGQSADHLASAMTGLVHATRGIIADQNSLIINGSNSNNNTSAAESTRRAVIQDIRQAVQLSYELVRAVKDTRIACDAKQPANAATVQSHSQQLTTQLIETLTRCLRGLPGHREISEATHLIEQKRSQLIQYSQPNQISLTARFVEPNEYQRKQTDLTQAAVEFNQATGELLSSYSPGSFKRTTRRFTGAYDYLTDKGIELSICNENLANNQQFEPVVNTDLLNGLINVSDQSYVLMNEASRVCCQPEAENLRGKFQSAARDVTESISQLLTICTSGVSPDQRECEAAIRRLDSLRPLLLNPNRPLNQHSYYDCVDTVAKSLEPLAESLRTMSTSARDQKPNEFSFAVRQCANSVCQLVEETAQTAYLIGLADRIENRRVSGATSISSGISSPPGSSSIDLDLFIQSQKEIQSACNAICEPNVNNRQVISLSTEMARSAKTLCEACSQLASQTTNIDTRQRLNNITKQTMQSITSLIQHRGSTVATDVNGEWSGSNRQQTLTNAQAVSANVANLVKLITTEPRLVDLTTSQERITNTTKETQRPVCVAGLESLNATQTVLRAAQNLLSTSRMGPSENAFMAFSSASKDLSNSIKVLANAMRENAPGQRECQYVFNNIKKLLHELQDARIASMENRLPPRRELNEEGFQRQLATSVRALLDSAPAVGRAASSEAEQLGRTILTWDSYLPGLVSGSIAAASRSPLSSTQLVYLDHACTVLEAASQLITVAKDSGGNPRAVHLHDSLNESVRGLVDSCEEFLTILDDVASRQGHVSTLIDTLNRAQAQAEEIIQVPMDARFSDYQTRMLRIARHMDQLNQAIQLRARQPASDGEIAPLAHNLTQEYQEMCQTCKGAAATLPDVNQADQLRSAVRGVGTACISLIQATTASRPDIYGSGTTTGGQNLLLSRNKSIVELDRRAEFLDSKLRNLINLLETHGPGTQACLQSASTVSGIISDLDTTILFASSGTLHPPVRDDFDAIWTDNEYGHSRLTTDRGHYLALSNNTDGTSIPSRTGSRSEMHNVENFTPLRESIARTARALVDDTQSLVSGTGEDQARLASTAHTAVERITELADVVKRGAAVIGPGQPDTQVELLTSSRDIATALRSVFLSAGKVQGRPSLDPVYDEVRSNAQVVISNVGQLLQTLKSVEEDERRGIRSLELAANYCREQAKLLPSSKDPEGLLTPNSSRKSGPRSISVASGSSSLIARYLAPDDLARAAGGPVQSAVSKAILANNTQIQRDIVQTSSATRDAVTDLVAAAKCLLRYSDIPPETRSSCAIVTRELAEEFAVLLDALKNGLCIPRKSDPENVSKIARRIADISHSLINLVDSLREGPRLIMYFRASSPEWRDVAEKFIGRHVAYHHHYVSNYALGGGSKSSHKSIFIRPTCYPLQLSSEQTMNDEAECRIVDAINQLNSSLEKCSADNKLAQSLLVTARSVAVSVQNLIKTARTVISAPPSDAVDRARTAEGASQKSTSSAALWRTELNVSLATQHLCQLSKLCSETVPSTTSKKLENSTGELSGGLILSRERLLAAVRQVATAGAQLLLAAKLRKEALMSADIRKLKTAGQAVKESTDLLAETVQRGDTVPSSSTSQRIEITWPTYTNQALLQGIHTKARIQSQQMELEALESHLASLKQSS